MPTFCRHNRLIQNCPICSREQAVEPRPLVSSSTPGTKERSDRPAQTSSSRARRTGSGRARGRPGAASGVTIRSPASGVDDGYRCGLVPGLKSRREAERLAVELAFATARLAVLADSPPGLYGEVADAGAEVEGRTWLAFLIAYLGPLEEVADPFQTIRSVRTTWASGELPELADAQTGPRTAHDPVRGLETVRSYRAWAERAGSQQAAFVGETSWSAERRFARVFERLALPGLHRGARFDLLVTLGRTGVYELRAGGLFLGGSDEVTLAAKRAFGIGDTLLLERRAVQLADACGVELEALDLGLYNWASGTRVRAGVEAEPNPEALRGAGKALGVDTEAGPE